MEKYLGSGSLDFCLFNDVDNIPKRAIKWYKDNDAEPVINNYGGKLKIIEKTLPKTDLKLIVLCFEKELKLVK